MLLVGIIILSITILWSTIVHSMSSSSSSSSSLHRRHLPRPLITPIIIGYAHDPKSKKAEQAIRDGCSVIIWSFVRLEIDDDTGQGKIQTALDLEEIRNIREKYDHVIHLAAFGGWNGPHPPDSSLTGKEWLDVFQNFNTLNGHILFDGIGK